MQRTGLFSQDLHGATVSRATSVEDLIAAYRLVHDVYVETGFMRPHRSGLRVRLFEAMPETATFIARKDERVVGVLSMVPDSPAFGLPSDLAFKAELDGLRRTGAKLGEVTNQAVSVDHRQSGIATELIRCAFAHRYLKGWDESVTTISPQHAPFYEVLGAREIGGRRSYSPLIYDQVVAMSNNSCDRWDPRHEPEPGDRFIHRYMITTNPYWSQMAQWDADAKRAFLEPGLLRRLFVEERGLLAQCSQAELEALRNTWGDARFASVWRP